MGLGFPNRITRADLGPPHVNEHPVEHPETEVGAEVVEPLLHQVVGANLVLPRAVVAANWNGADFDYEHQQEAWNPDNAQVRPVLDRSGTGVYTWTFASTYKDETGEDIATLIRAPRISSHKTLSAFADRIVAEAWIPSGTPLVVQVRLWSAAGTPEDAPFRLEVL